MDKDGYLRIITINTKKLPRGYVDTNEITAESVKKTIIKVEDTSRHELQKALNEGGIELKLTDEEFKENNEDQTDYESLRKALWNTKIQTEDTQAEEMETVSPSEGDEAKPGGGLKKSITLKQLFTSAKTLPEINKVYALAQQLKTNPKVIAVKGLIDPILQQISEKREKIRLETISQSLQEIVAELPTLSDFSDMIIIKNKLTHIKKERSQIIVVDKDFDALIKETLTTVEEKITEYQSSHQAEIHKNIEVNIELIEEYMKNIDYLVQITSVYNTELRKQTKELLTYLPEEDKKTLDDKLVNLVKQRQTELKSLAQQEVKGQQEKQQKTIEKILNQINDIKDIVLSITEEDTLDQMEKSDPLVREVKQGIEELPAQKAQELSIKLDQIFKERSLSIKFSKEETKGSFKNLDQYGIPKSLYFVPEIQKKVKWEIYGKPTKDNKYKLQFRSSAGNIIEPDINKKILGNYEFEYTQEEWIALKKKINERNSNEIKKKYYDLLKNITS
ncbi:MAG: hypothetical protein LBO09_04060 [Candidatus Peribacteria bacterium]|jgi:hypothetical protein|nr:hypothetical protein [Candidatus Peribacteria bacterium]